MVKTACGLIGRRIAAPEVDVCLADEVETGKAKDRHQAKGAER